MVTLGKNMVLFVFLAGLFSFSVAHAQELSATDFLKPLTESTVPEKVVHSIQETLQTSSSTSYLIATVNFLSARIISQQGNTFALKFTIGNREGVQPQILYSVELVKSGDQKNPDVVFNQKTYANDILSLSANDSVEKTISYEAPAFLAGTYTLKLHARNEAGLDLALITVGTVTLSGSGAYLSIENASCVLHVVKKGKADTAPYTLSQGALLFADDLLQAVCPVSNQSGRDITATPSFQVYERTISGNIVRAAQTAPISFKKGESKKITITLPKESSPQAYYLKMVLNDEQGNPSSNETIIPYTVYGDFATIITTLLDKDIYRAGDSAAVTSRVSASSPEVLKSATLALGIKDGSGKVCANENVMKIDEDSVFVTVRHTLPILLDCKNPVLGVVLKDVKGKVLDEKVFSVETKVKSGTKRISANDIIVFLSALIAAILALVLYRRSKQQRSQIPLATLLLIGCVGAFFTLGVQPAYADTYAGTFGSTIEDGTKAFGGDRVTYSATINYSAKTVTVPNNQPVVMDALLSVNINLPSYIYMQADLICAVDVGAPSEPGYQAGQYQMYLYTGGTYDILHGGVTISRGATFDVVPVLPAIPNLPLLPAKYCSETNPFATVKCTVLTRINNPIENKVRGIGGVILNALPALAISWAIPGSELLFNSLLSVPGLVVENKSVNTVGTTAILGKAVLPPYNILLDKSLCTATQTTSTTSACPAGQVFDANGVCITPPVPSPTTNLAGSCSASGASTSFSWSPVSGATYYQLRVVDTENRWTDCNSATSKGGLCEDIMGANTTSKTFQSIPGHTYEWWVHVCNGGSVCSTLATAPPVVCPIPSDTTPVAQTCGAPAIGGVFPSPYRFSFTIPDGNYWGSNAEVSYAQIYLNTNGTPRYLDSGQIDALHFHFDQPFAAGHYVGALNNNTNSCHWDFTVCEPGASVVRGVCTAIAPTVSLTASPSTINTGQSAKLFWISSNATSCSAVGSAFATGGATGNSAGVTINPPGTSSYQITCSGSGGTTSSNIATVTVLNPQITRFTITPERITSGSQITVSWATTDVDSCTLTKNGTAWRSNVSANGNTTDTVSAQTTYGISCANGAGGVATAKKVVNTISSFTEF